MFGKVMVLLSSFANEAWQPRRPPSFLIREIRPPDNPDEYSLQQGFSKYDLRNLSLTRLNVFREALPQPKECSYLASKQFRAGQHLDHL